MRPAFLFVPLAAALLAIPSRAAEPSGPGREDSCVECHADVEADLDSRVKHPPAAEGNCVACHNPHVSRFPGLLRDRPGPLCFTCHADVGKEVGRKNVHVPAAEGKCSACHRPHGGALPALLRDSRESLCRSCHPKVGEWAARPVRHAPFAQGECGSCHAAHGSDHAGITRAGRGDLCSRCHPANDLFRRAHRGYPVERADCTQCHDPHASQREGLFRERLHEPYAAGDCTACHPLPGSSEPFRPKSGLAALCGSCHEDVVLESARLPVPHVSSGGAGCTACHNPHTGGDSLLAGPVQELCLTCHDPGGVRAEAAGRYPTHADLDCTTCHAPHGGERPLLLQAGTVELCSGCHEAQHTVTHPLGEGAPDPRNRAPMECSSCHGIHAAPFEKYLVLSGERDLCLSCHREILGKR